MRNRKGQGVDQPLKAAEAGAVTGNTGEISQDGSVSTVAAAEAQTLRLNSQKSDIEKQPSRDVIPHTSQVLGVAAQAQGKGTVAFSVLNIPLSQIMLPSTQVRESTPECTTAVTGLANSIKKLGLQQPLVVRPITCSDGRNMFVVASGYLRFLAVSEVASQWPAFQTVPCRVVNMSDKEALTLSLVENVCRRDLAPVELAKALHSLIADGQYTMGEVEAMFGKKHGWAAQKLHLLTYPEIADAVAAKKINPTVGYMTAQSGNATIVEVVLNSAQDGKRIRTRDVRELCLKAAASEKQECETSRGAADVIESHSDAIEGEVIPVSPPAVHGTDAEVCWDRLTVIALYGKAQAATTDNVPCLEVLEALKADVAMVTELLGRATSDAAA